MRRFSSIFCLLAVSLGGSVIPAYPSSFGYTDSVAHREIRWSQRTIRLALSATLNSPGPNIKLGSDVAGAVRRAISRWSSVANLKFVMTESEEQSISPTTGGDGVSLITIGDTVQNSSIFASGPMTGRTRIFYDKNTGEISEADIVINPHPVSPDGSPVQFSTDGTPGTYDLESTFTHELGHLLGLDHSPVLSSTMHARQPLNGLYNRRAFTERTLSEDDRAQVRSLYGPELIYGVLEGRISRPSAGGTRSSASGVPVWVEENKTGRLIASTSTSVDGTYRLANLAPNRYRVFAGQVSLQGITETSFARMQKTVEQPRGERGAELGSQIEIVRNEERSVNLIIPPQTGPNRYLNPRLIGTNSELSIMSIPAEAGKTLTIFVAGEGVDQVSGNGVVITSPFFTVQPSTLKVEPFNTSFPVISFEVSVAPNIPFGDYSVRLQSNSGDVAYLPGVITVDPGVESAAANPMDDPRFFVKQHYLDFLGRQPETAGMEYWLGQLEQCGQDIECQRNRRLSVAAAFLGETEFQRKGFLVYQLYRVGLGRRPLFSEFASDRKLFPENSNKTEEPILKLTEELVQRPEFVKRYPLKLTGEEFVDNLLSNLQEMSGVDLTLEREGLVSLIDGSPAGRAAVVRRIAENSELMKVEQDKAFLLMQYFGYLARDPDEEGYRFWLNVLANKPERDANRYTPVICAFISSAEYQSRFGMLLTHDSSECR